MKSLGCYVLINALVLFVSGEDSVRFLGTRDGENGRVICFKRPHRHIVSEIIILISRFVERARRSTTTPLPRLNLSAPIKSSEFALYTA